jgi:hypothetical protein
MSGVRGATGFAGVVATVVAAELLTGLELTHATVVRTVHLGLLCPSIHARRDERANPPRTTGWEAQRPAPAGITEPTRS